MTTKHILAFDKTSSTGYAKFTIEEGNVILGEYDSTVVSCTSSLYVVKA